MLILINKHQKKLIDVTLGNVSLKQKKNNFMSINIKKINGIKE